MASIDVVEDISPRVQYIAAPGQTAFDYPFPIFEEENLVVDVDGVLQALTTDYTVTGEGNKTGGTVTFLSALTGDEVVTVYRDIAIERITDFQQNGPRSSAALNDELDRLTLVDQQLEARIGRAIRLPITAEATDASLELSPISNWFGKFLRISAAGLLEAAEVVSGVVELTRSVIGSLLNPRTAAESAASVFPSDYAYAEGDDRRYSTLHNWAAVVSRGVEGHIWVDHSIASMVTVTGDAVINVHGRRTITATASMVNMIRTQGRATITADEELLFDGNNNVTGACLHYEEYFPNLKNVRALDAALGFAGGTAAYNGSAYGPVGDFEWVNVTAENCSDCGWSLRSAEDRLVTAASSANPISMTVTNHGLSTGNILDFDEFTGDFSALNGRRYPITVTGTSTFTVAVDGSSFAAYGGDAVVSYRTSRGELRNCRTKGTTGSGVFSNSGKGFLYHVAGLLSYARWGGIFMGDQDADCTDGYKCSHAEIHGGWHDKVGRGPTIGFNTHLFVIDGACASDIVDNAFSADTTDGSGDTVGVGAITGNVASRAARAVRTTSSFIAVSANFSYQCTQQSAHYVAAGEGAHVFMDGNYAYRSEGTATTAYVAYGAVEGATLTLGVNGTNSTHREAFSAPSSTLIKRLVSDGIVRPVSENVDLSGTDRVLVVDASAGSVDIDLFDAADVRSTGFECTLIKTDTANSITLTFQGGAANGETVNGVSALSIPASYSRRPLRIFCVDGAAGTWIVTPPPPTAYSVTNETVDRSFDADTAADAEISDVVGTILRDLGWTANA